MWAANYVFLCSRREMMPILSLIFSALFILFGTVIIQAFRWEKLILTHWKYDDLVDVTFTTRINILILFESICVTSVEFISFVKWHSGSYSVHLAFFSVNQVRANRRSQNQKNKLHTLRTWLQVKPALRGNVMASITSQEILDFPVYKEMCFKIVGLKVHQIEPNSASAYYKSTVTRSLCVTERSINFLHFSFVVQSSSEERFCGSDRADGRHIHQ